MQKWNKWWDSRNAKLTDQDDIKEIHFITHLDKLQYLRRTDGQRQDAPIQLQSHQVFLKSTSYYQLRPKVFKKKKNLFQAHNTSSALRDRAKRSLNIILQSIFILDYKHLGNRFVRYAVNKQGYTIRVATDIKLSNSPTFPGFTWQIFNALPWLLIVFYSIVHIQRTCSFWRHNWFSQLIYIEGWFCPQFTLFSVHHFIVKQLPLTNCDDRC